MMKNRYILPVILLCCGATPALAQSSRLEKLDTEKIFAALEDPSALNRLGAAIKVSHLSYQLNGKQFEASKYREQMITALKKLLADSEPTVRYAGALALADVAFRDKTERSWSLPVLIEAVKDKPFNSTRILPPIMHELSSRKYELGTGKEELITALKERLNSRPKDIRYTAAIALGKLDGKNTIELIMPVFLEALADTDKSVVMFYRESIVSVCGQIGPGAEEAVPAIIRAMKEEKWPGSDIYKTALLEIGTPEAMDAAAGGRILRLLTQFIAYHPVGDFFITFFFGWLFWKSVKLRRQGKKVFHWLLIVPFLIYAVDSLVYTVQALLHYSSNFTPDMLSNRWQFMFLASISLIPWLMSWLFIWRREKKQKQGAS